MKLSRGLLMSTVVFITAWCVTLHSIAVEGRRTRKPKEVIPVPTFVKTESNYTYHKGERAILYCSIENLGTKTVIWRRSYEGSPPLTIGKMTYVDDERFEVGHIVESQDWNLMISNVTTAETGTYECQVAAKDRTLRKEVHLHVKDEFSYKEPLILVSGTLHVDKGMPMTLVCNATGATTPPDYIDWFKDGTKITTNKKKRVDLTKQYSINTRTISSTLRKQFAEMTDTGTYVCRTSDLQVTSVKVNVLNTQRNSIKRVLKDPEIDADGRCIANCDEKPESKTGDLQASTSRAGKSMSTSSCLSLIFFTCLASKVYTILAEVRCT